MAGKCYVNYIRARFTRKTESVTTATMISSWACGGQGVEGRSIHSGSGRWSKGVWSPHPSQILSVFLDLYMHFILSVQTTHVSLEPLQCFANFSCGKMLKEQMWEMRDKVWVGATQTKGKRTETQRPVGWGVLYSHLLVRVALPTLKQLYCLHFFQFWLFQSIYFFHWTKKYLLKGLEKLRTT